ncbi:MAG: EAL domain-containing protein [Steroidobacteraceae bacterium]
MRQSRRALWEALAFSLIMLIVVATAIFGLCVTTESAALAGFRHYLVNLLLESSVAVDPQLHESIRRPEQLNDPDYSRAVEPLRRIRRAVPDVRYIYTLVMSDGQVHFVLDAAEPGAVTPSGRSEQSGVWEVYPELSDNLKRAMGLGGRPGIAIANQEPVTDAWGTFMSGFAPIRDPRGRQIGVIGIDVDASKLVARLNRLRREALTGLAPAGILIAVAGVLFYRVRRRGLADAHSVLESAAEANRTAQVLAEERRRLGEVIEGTNVGTWEWHAGKCGMSVSERIAQMTGHSLADLQQWELLQWRSLVHPDDSAGWERAVIASIADPNTVLVHEIRVRRADGNWLWLLIRGKVLQSDAQDRPALFAGIAVDISDRKALEMALIDSAQRDRLTGLPNRSVFMERLAGALTRVRNGEQPACAVLFFDFDRFKQINDTLGHEAGDELLRQIAGRLQTAMRAEERHARKLEGDVLSRFGGDEFLVLVNDLRSCDEAVRVAERLLNVLVPSYNILGHEVHSSASVGIVTTDRCQGSAEEFVRNADVAMYEAKRAGRGCSVVFSEAMHERLTRHLAIETSLRRAIGTDQLYVEYQPVVDLESGRRRSVEVSVCWNHPSLGAIAASEFVPIAAESGLLVVIGQWAIRQACRAMVAWRADDADSAPDTVSINLCRAQIACGDRFVEHIVATLEAYELAPAHLQIEVSEREVMANRTQVGPLFAKLRRLGVKLAIDEFGAGHSSLSVLRSYPVDTVKIDDSFLTDLHGSHAGMAVMSATLTLIRNLGALSVATGVQHEAQVAILQSLGCHCAQGAYYGTSMPATRVIAATSTPRAELPL